MTGRVENGQTYTQTFDAENRLVAVAVGADITTLVYDADGALVKTVRPDNTATVYIGAVYEVELSALGAVTKTTAYYNVPGARVMRVDGTTLTYVLLDHLGSANVTLDDDGDVLGEMRYFPYGETRLATGSVGSDKLFTGQRSVEAIGLIHFNARWYHPTLMRFVSADTIVPEPGNPQALNRLAYTVNNPIRYTDPTGHAWDDGLDGGCGICAPPPSNSPPPVVIPTAPPSVPPQSTPQAPASNSGQATTSNAGSEPFAPSPGNFWTAAKTVVLAFNSSGIVRRNPVNPFLLPRELGGGLVKWQRPDVVGAAAAAIQPVSKGISYGLSVVPNQIGDFQSGASPVRHTTDFVIDTGGFLFAATGAEAGLVIAASLGFGPAGTVVVAALVGASFSLEYRVIVDTTNARDNAEGLVNSFANPYPTNPVSHVPMIAPVPAPVP